MKYFVDIIFMLDGSKIRNLQSILWENFSVLYAWSVYQWESFFDHGSNLFNANVLQNWLDIRKIK